MKKLELSFLQSKAKKRELVLAGLANAKEKKELLERMTVLQNEISVAFNTKVVAIAGVNDDDLAAHFAKAFVEAYSMNGSTSLIIDANLYDQKLKALLSNSGDSVRVNAKEEGKEKGFIALDEKTNAYCLDNEIYPSTVYKSGAIQQIIKDNKEKYDHFVLIVPQLKDHKEISLLADVIESIVLVAQKDVTTKKRIFEAIQYLAVAEMPLAKTVVLK